MVCVKSSTEPSTFDKLAVMLSAMPAVIIESGTDWPAIIASISTGVAAVAGIAGTIWQASRNWNHDDKRTRLAEKRRTYASCLTTFNTGIQAAILMQIQLQQVENSPSAPQRS